MDSAHSKTHRAQPDVLEFYGPRVGPAGDFARPPSKAAQESPCSTRKNRPLLKTLRFYCPALVSFPVLDNNSHHFLVATSEAEQILFGIAGFLMDSAVVPGWFRGGSAADLGWFRGGSGWFRVVPRPNWRLRSKAWARGSAATNLWFLSCFYVCCMSYRRIGPPRGDSGVARKCGAAAPFKHSKRGNLSSAAGLCT